MGCICSLTMAWSSLELRAQTLDQDEPIRVEVEAVNVLVTVTPTVIDFEKKADIDRAAERAREELGKGFSLEEEVVPAGVAGAR